MLSESAVNIAVDYATGNSSQIDSLTEQYLLYALNDLNSSSLRQLITAKVCKCNPSSIKHGPDCHDPLENRQKEIKPKLYTDTKKRANGSGNFSDYTRQRWINDSNNNIGVIVSLFYSNKIVYAIEFAFDAIKNKLDEQITKKCELANQDYVRTAMFSYADWIGHPSVKVHYINSRMVADNKEIFVKKFHKFLMTYC
jgi:hypothetical protein